MSESDEERTLSRRRLLQVAGATSAVVATAGLVLASGDPAFATGSQSSWRYCGNCKMMWFAGQGASQNGSCPGSANSHIQFGSGNYTIKFYPNGNGQSGWQFCRSCYVMNFPAATDAPFVCPITGQDHNSYQSGNYEIEWTGSNDGPGGQTNWWWCIHCTGLYFGGASSNGYCIGRSNRSLGHANISTNHNYVLRYS